MVVAQRVLTLEEFLCLPERKPALEYEDGVITQKVSPKGRHSALQDELMERFNAVGKRHRRARAFPELRVTFAGRSYVPDVAVYRWDRIPLTPDGEIVDDFATPPDITVEIVSPKQSVTALMRRCLWYVANGVKVSLLVDPGDRSVLIVRPGGGVQVVRGEGTIDVSDALAGFQLTAAELFASLKLA
ncbi:MAG TPA: Uma2 family endonuclease [Chloroflexota bacterium]|jgi:Uma2 family endonuclease|nr:Uma2 family endonuclease [Chloroflexota bacterium]